MTTDGYVVDSSGNVVEGTLISGNGSKESDKATVRDSLLHNDGKGLTEKHKQSLAEAIRRGLKIQREEAKWGKPGSGELEVRKQGIFLRPNATDQRRVEVAKTNTDRAILLGHHLMQLEKYAAGGKKSVMETLRYVMEMDAEFPEALQDVGEELTEIIATVVTGTFSEDLQMLAQRALELIDQATNGKDTKM